MRNGFGCLNGTSFDFTKGQDVQKKPVISIVDAATPSAHESLEASER